MAPLKLPAHAGPSPHSPLCCFSKKGRLMISRKSPWSENDLQRLAAIIAAGGTAMRASAALKRRIASCQLQARKMGTPFTLQHINRKHTKEKCEAAERELARR
jgi:hypothetical protein